MFSIGVDIGYGQTKVYLGAFGEEGKSIVFPTKVSSYVPEETFSNQVVVGVNGDSFNVGENALRE